MNQDNLATAIEIAPNAVDDPIELVYSDLPEPGDVAGDLQFAGRFFRLIAYHDGSPRASFVFRIPMRMVLEYREADLNGVSEEELQLRYFDPATAEWRTDGIVIEQRDPPNNRITVSIAHLTDFALVGADRKIFLPSISR
jgi:hypothetical protein